MLVTKQPVLRHFWYPVMPMEMVGAGPRPFTLLGEHIVVWTDATGAPHAARDRCPHRSARLSEGWVEDGKLICGYHGWTFGGDGRCVRMPQRPDRLAPAELDMHFAAARYGYVWVSLDEPLFDIPEIPETADRAFRMVPEFYEVWRCAGLRLMENEFDNAHVAFVHRETFGVLAEPDPPRSSITDTANGFEMRTIFNVRNNDLQQRNLNTDSERVDRDIVMTWFMPFSRTLDIRYPGGLRHMIFTAAAPIDDEHSQFVQFAVRNDTEAEAPAADVVAFDRQVTSEDRAILEATDPDVPLDLRSRREVHMASDRPGLVMRRKLAELLAARGEPEAVRDRPVAV